MYIVNELELDHLKDGLIPRQTVEQSTVQWLHRHGFKSVQAFLQLHKEHISVQ